MNSQVVFLLYQKGRDSRIFQAPATADRLRHRHRLSARANGSAHVGVVPLQPFAKAEPPACSDLEVDPVRPQRAPGGDPAIGGDHHAVDEAGSAEPVEADAQIRLLHDQQRGAQSLARIASEPACRNAPQGPEPWWLRLIRSAVERRVRLLQEYTGRTTRGSRPGPGSCAIWPPTKTNSLQPTAGTKPWVGAEVTPRRSRLSGKAALHDHRGARWNVVMEFSVPGKVIG